MSKKYPQFVAGTPIGTDIILYADPVTGALKKVTLDSLISAVGVISVVKITKTFADFAEPAQTKTISSGFMLPANATLLHVQTNTTVPFAVGITPEGPQLSVGIISDPAFWVSGMTLFLPVLVHAQNGLVSTSSETDVQFTLLDFVNLDTYTAGAFDTWIFYSILP